MFIEALAYGVGYDLYDDVETKIWAHAVYLAPTRTHVVWGGEVWAASNWPNVKVVDIVSQNSFVLYNRSELVVQDGLLH